MAKLKHNRKISMTKFISLIFVFCFLLSSKAQNAEKCLTELEEKLTPKVNKENIVGEIINIRDKVTCFDWDTLIVQMAINPKDMTEKAMGINIPFNYDYSWENDNTALLLFVKDNVVVNYILQKPTVSREAFNTAKSVKAYSFLKLVNNFGDNAYAKIPRENTVFETYQILYHDEKGAEVSNPKFGHGIKVKNQ